MSKIRTDIPSYGADEARGVRYIAPKNRLNFSRWIRSDRTHHVNSRQPPRERGIRRFLTLEGAQRGQVKAGFTDHGCVGSPPTLSLGSELDPGVGSDAGADGSCLQPTKASEANNDAYTKVFFIERSPGNVN